MSSPPKGAKVIPITRGFRKAAAANRPAPVPGHGAPLQQMLDRLHPRVRAVLVERAGKWEFFERLRDDPAARSILAEIELPDLLGILSRAYRKEEVGQRITISPWPGFDLAVLLRDGKPRYAACFDAETSIYLAEEILPKVARFFDDGLVE